MQSIDFQGRKVAYTVNNSKGMVAVFLHGFCEDSSMWDDFIEAFEEFQVVRVDLPGFGGSDVVEGISIQGMASRVMAVIDHLKIEKYFLIGHSMGGYTALEVAKQRPDQILGFGMFHSHPFADSDDKKQSREKALEFIGKNGHELYVKQLLPSLFAPNFAKSHTYLVDKMILRASKFPKLGITTALEAMKNRPDNSDVLRNIQCPVLFIIGELDQSVPLDISVEQTHLPAIAEIHIMPKVGHMGMIRSERETQLIVHKFMEFCLEQAAV
jgi:pimeloyl-ACP methyl ester carboxylesterase